MSPARGRQLTVSANLTPSALDLALGTDIFDALDAAAAEYLREELTGMATFHLRKLLRRAGE